MEWVQRLFLRKIRDQSSKYKDIGFRMVPTVQIRGGIVFQDRNRESVWRKRLETENRILDVACNKKIIFFCSAVNLPLQILSRLGICGGVSLYRRKHLRNIWNRILIFDFWSFSSELLSEVPLRRTWSLSRFLGLLLSQILLSRSWYPLLFLHSTDRSQTKRVFCDIFWTARQVYPIQYRSK